MAHPLLSSKLPQVRESVFRGLWRIIFAPSLFLTIVNSIVWYQTKTASYTFIVIRDWLFILFLIGIPPISRITRRYVVLCSTIMIYLSATLILKRDDYATFLATFSFVFLLPVFFSGLLLGWQAVIVSSCFLILLHIAMPLTMAHRITANVLYPIPGMIIVYGMIMFAVRLIEQGQRDLANLASSLDRQVAERTKDLSDSEASKQLFFHMMAHRTRTPINTLLSATELVTLAVMEAQQGDPTLLQDITPIMERSAALLLILNERMVLIGQTSASTQPLIIIRNPITMKTLFEHVLNALPHNHGRIILSPTNLDTIQTIDARMIEQALLICLEMLLEALPEITPIHIEFRSLPHSSHILITTDYMPHPLLKLMADVLNYDVVLRVIRHEQQSLQLAKRIIETHQGKIGIVYEPNTAIQIQINFHDLP